MKTTTSAPAGRDGRRLGRFLDEKDYAYPSPDMRSLLACLSAGILFSATACSGSLDVGSNLGPSQGGGPPPRSGRFVALGSDRLFLSDDGSSWRDGRSFAVRPVAVAGQGVRTVLIDASGASFVSTDLGETWSPGSRALKPEEGASIDVTHDGRQFVAVTGGWTAGAASAVSENGITWRDVGGPQNFMFGSVFRTPGGVRVSANYRSDLLTPAIFGLEGETWREIETAFRPPSTAEPLREGLSAASLAPDGSAAFAVVRTTVFRTTAGDSWVALATSDSPKPLRAVATSGTRTVAVGEQASVFVVGDGGFRASSTIAGSTAPSYLSVAYGKSVFVALGASGTADGTIRAVSTDGATWETAPLRGSVGFARIVFLPGSEGEGNGRPYRQ